MSEELLNYLEGFMTPERRAKFEQVLNDRTYHFTVAIEDVFQAHNTSAVIRSCDVFGIQSAHVIEDRFGRKLDKNIAMGAQKWVNVSRFDNAMECMKDLREKGYRIVATTPHKTSCDLESFDIAPRSAFFFGTERKGLSETVLSQADDFLTIPMYGFTESLNISVSAAIILQRLTQRLRSSKVEWQLKEEEKHQLRIDWAKKSIRSIDDVLKRFTEN
ncbi:TrmH family RNA methyltransferase [Robertkochia aurantiaca]|uniref:TrmH family RNA methyltransferase n=1 Tax=Robertkochia aurantiaca TaxID=2873700 RepID=UPI001CCA1718|nr:RNA methyltransferase [Robertkochia sp. 3YJGBD-33]